MEPRGREGSSEETRSNLRAEVSQPEEGKRECKWSNGMKLGINGGEWD